MLFQGLNSPLCSPGREEKIVQGLDYRDAGVFGIIVDYLAKCFPFVINSRWVEGVQSVGLSTLKLRIVSFPVFHCSPADQKRQ